MKHTVFLTLFAFLSGCGKAAVPPHLERLKQEHADGATMADIRNALGGFHVDAAVAKWKSLQDYARALNGEEMLGDRKVAEVRASVNHDIVTDVISFLAEQFPAYEVGRLKADVVDRLVKGIDDPKLSKSWKDRVDGAERGWQSGVHLDFSGDPPKWILAVVEKAVKMKSKDGPVYGYRPTLYSSEPRITLRCKIAEVGKDYLGQVGTTVASCHITETVDIEIRASAREGECPWPPTWSHRINYGPAPESAAVTWTSRGGVQSIPEADSRRTRVTEELAFKLESMPLLTNGK